jgi:hypothetical protein
VRLLKKLINVPIADCEREVYIAVKRGRKRRITNKNTLVKDTVYLCFKLYCCTEIFPKQSDSNAIFKATS